MQQALSHRRISEGHTRPLLMLSDRPEEQETLFREILLRKMSVRDAERISRKVARDKVRKKKYAFDADILELEKEAGETLGTRVHIEAQDNGGKIMIDFFTDEDLRNILTHLRERRQQEAQSQTTANIANTTAPTATTAAAGIAATTALVMNEAQPETPSDEADSDTDNTNSESPIVAHADNEGEYEDMSAHESDQVEDTKDDEDEFSLQDFTI
jgi:hypothetical protein